jgi:hypothetical protein
LGDQVISRLKVAALFFVAGAAFVALVEVFSNVACNGSCPEWFTLLAVSQLLLPLLWAVVGHAAGAGRRLAWFAAVCLLSALFAFALHQQTAAYTARAISG